MEETLLRIQPLVEWFILRLQSEQAMFALSWFALFACLGFSALVSYWLLSVVRSFNEAHLIRIFPGARPVVKMGIEKRIRELQTHASSLTTKLIVRSFGLLIVGLIIPGLVIGLIATQENWFLGGSIALALNGLPTASHSLEVTDVAVFVLDQAVRGALGDTLEVFNIGITPVSNNAGNFLFSVLVLLYRAIAGAVFVTVVYVFGRAIRGRQDLKEAITELKKDLRKLNPQSSAQTI